MSRNFADFRVDALPELLKDTVLYLTRPFSKTSAEEMFGVSFKSMSKLEKLILDDGISEDKACRLVLASTLKDSPSMDSKVSLTDKGISIEEKSLTDDPEVIIRCDIIIIRPSDKYMPPEFEYEVHSSIRSKGYQISYDTYEKFDFGNLPVEVLDVNTMAAKVLCVYAEAREKTVFSFRKQLSEFLIGINEIYKGKE